MSRALGLVGVLVFGASSLLAQVVGGSVGGTVTDASGAAVRGAKVVIRNTETGTERTLVTGADGRYAAPSLPVGEYNVVVTGDGFNRFERRGVQLVVGQSLPLDVALSVGGRAETVDVSAEGATVNVSTEQTAGLVNERQVKELPLNGRSYDQLITLNPGTVNYTGQRSGGVATSNSSVPSVTCSRSPFAFKSWTWVPATTPIRPAGSRTVRSSVST